MSDAQQRHPAAGLTPADDIQSLRGHLPNLQFPYIDISVIRQHKETMRQWPLLRELNELGKGRDPASESVDPANEAKADP